MTTYSAAWAAADPAVRDFYVSWAHINSAHNWHVGFCWRYWLDPDDFCNTDPLYDCPNCPQYEYFPQFIIPGQALPGYLGYHIAQRNWGCQTSLTGSFNTSIVLLQIPAWTNTDNIEPYYDITGCTSYYDSFESVPELAYNYPRLRYKVRKSYWTGAPRRRRNL